MFPWEKEDPDVEFVLAFEHVKYDGIKDAPLILKIKKDGSATLSWHRSDVLRAECGNGRDFAEFVRMELLK